MKIQRRTSPLQWAVAVGGAVKAFDPTVDHTRSPNWRQHLDEAVELELAAAQAGLPVPRPIPVAGTTTTMLADLPGTAVTVTVTVHEWVDGRRLPDHRRRTADQAVPGLLDQLQRFTAGSANWTRWLADA